MPSTSGRPSPLGEDGESVEEVDEVGRGEAMGEDSEASESEGEGGKSYVNWSPAPRDSNFYEHFRWSARRVENDMTTKRLTTLREEYVIPECVAIRLPEEGDDPTRPHDGWTMMYADMFKHGVRLPLDPGVREWLVALSITQFQMAPNLLWAIHTLFILWRERGWDNPSTQVLFHAFNLQKCPGSIGYYSLTTKGDR